VESVAVPQHLDLEDVVAWGLSATDLLFAVAGVAIGWWLALRTSDALGLELAVGAPPALLGLALGGIRLGERSLRSWSALALRYAIRPHRLLT
jgi:hypothetical protein